MKRILLVLFLLSLPLKAEELKWEIGDYAWINQCCLKPDVLQAAAELRQTESVEGIQIANILWYKAVKDGLCYDVFPRVFKVKLIELIEIYDNLYTGYDSITGYLYKVEVYEKGGTGDFEPTNLFVYAGVFQKDRSRSHRPDLENWIPLESNLGV